MNKKPAATLVLLILLGLFLFVNQWILPEISILEEVIVTDYQGQDFALSNEISPDYLKKAPRIDGATYRLEVTGLVEEPKNYTYGQVIKGFNIYEKLVTLDAVDEWNSTISWRGVLLKDLIQESKPLDNGTMITVYSADGNVTTFSREYIEDKNILLAYQLDNVTLSRQRGFPLQLVAESKIGDQWLRWVNRIEISAP